MSRLKRTAICAALSIFAVAALSGSGAASAFGAADVVEAERSSLLPGAVYEAAAQEGETPVDYTIIPETPESPLAGDETRVTLSQLVALHAGSETSSREEECLAGAVYFEAKGEPLDGQLAVAQVIMNRARSGRFPSSVCGVVFQPSQFSFVRGNSFPPIARSSHYWQQAVAIAKIAGNDMWNSTAGSALYFHARRVSPGWRLNRVATIGNHVFYR
ncbi:cell wall hydrolase [Aquisediminimonas profunda]|uniref:cell wall hydrolase n=1 Tax=Aquisediminimonas profunda TaxID=1550733 RepID=UPI001C62A116|nr:cell wall hydrolase [Aquisediminimonas profunda]